MKPPVREFTKEHPCTKLDIWNCFAARDSGFHVVQVDIAHSKIGKNVPRVMERNGYLEKAQRKGEDVYMLTAKGRQWLTIGIQHYLRNHPTHASRVTVKPPERGNRVVRNPPPIRPVVDTRRIRRG